MLLLLTALQSCNLPVYIAFSHTNKKTVNNWKDKKYKVRIQDRQGWSGPHYYHCRVKEKKLGGLYYKKIISETFSREEYSNCKADFLIRKDTMTVDFCNKIACKKGNKK